MKTVTDLGEIKKLARMFVHLDIQSTEYSPLIVKHPFTDSGMIAYRTDDGGIAQADITSDPAALKLWQEEKLRQIKEARTPHEISFMITKSYSLAFLKYAAPHLSSKDLSEMLADVWVRTEIAEQRSEYEQEQTFVPVQEGTAAVPYGRGRV